MQPRRIPEAGAADCEVDVRRHQTGTTGDALESCSDQTPGDVGLLLPQTNHSVTSRGVSPFPARPVPSSRRPVRPRPIRPVRARVARSSSPATLAARNSNRGIAGWLEQPRNPCRFMMDTSVDGHRGQGRHHPPRRDVESAVTHDCVALRLPMWRSMLQRPSCARGGVDPTLNAHRCVQPDRWLKVRARSLSPLRSPLGPSIVTSWRRAWRLEQLERTDRRSPVESVRAPCLPCKHGVSHQPGRDQVATEGAIAEQTA